MSYLKKLVFRTKPGNVTEEQALELRKAKEALEQSAGMLLNEQESA